jgi:hypothetical protein
MSSVSKTRMQGITSLAKALENCIQKFPLDDFPIYKEKIEKQILKLTKACQRKVK